jgi:putative toxin-antitoxin system antitoxin component (TIGR02293 family)
MNGQYIFEVTREILGVGQNWTTPIQLIDAIKSGFSLEVLDRIVHLVAPYDRSFKYRIVPKSSLQRLRGARRARALLSSYQSQQVMRIALVWGMTMKVWRNEEAARRFLTEPHMLLDNWTPLDMALAADIGVALTEDILGRLQYASAA